MLPPSYYDHAHTPPPSFDSLALLFSHYPIITQLAKLVTTGDCMSPPHSLLKLQALILPQ